MAASFVHAAGLAIKANPRAVAAGGFAGKDPSHTGMFPPVARCVRPPEDMDSSTGQQSWYPSPVPFQKLAAWFWRVRDWNVQITHTRTGEQQVDPGQFGVTSYQENLVPGSLQVQRKWRTVNSVLKTMCDRAPAHLLSFKVSIRFETKNESGQSSVFTNEGSYQFAFFMGTSADFGSSVEFWREPQSGRYWPQLGIGTGSGTMIMDNRPFIEANEWGSPKSTLTVDGVSLPVARGAKTFANYGLGDMPINGNTSIRLSPVYF